jgi:DNA-directed RNA polymerase beta subunit
MNSLSPIKPKSKPIMSSNQNDKPIKKVKPVKPVKSNKKLATAITAANIEFDIDDSATEKEKEIFDILKDTYIESPWTIIGSYFQDKHLDRLVRHQLESYNNFVGLQLPQTIDMFNEVHIKSENDFDKESGKYSLEIFIKFENFHIYRPQIHENNGAIKVMFPHEARLRNFTYASAMTIDINIRYIVRNGENLGNTSTFYKTLSKIHIGKLPIMLKSNICVLSQYKYVDNEHTGECSHDSGGYFIINGSEKTVLGQERAAENRVYCFNISKNNTKYDWSAEIKSVPDFKCISPKQINMMISSKNNGFGKPIVVQIPRVKQPIPLFIVFRALGIMSDKEICEYILLNLAHEKCEQMLQNLQASIIEAHKYNNKEDAIRFIMSFVIYTPINMDKETGARKKYEFTLDVLNNDLYPHCNTPQQKIFFLGYMAQKLMKANFELIKADDRDSYINKRVDLTGTSLNNLFRNYFNKLVKDMEKQIVKEINNGSWRSTEDYLNIVNLTNIYKIVKSTTIENGFKRALATGDFGIKHANSNKVGVAQVLNRLTYVSSLSHLRRISTPTDKSGKLVPPRKLHGTSFGFLCPAETPEGGSVGIVKNLSYMTHVTIHSNSKSLYDYIRPEIKCLEQLSPIEVFGQVKVFINGAWIGISETPVELYVMLKEMKCKGIINIYTSIIFDYKLGEIRVCNDSGRVTRPLLRVKDKNILLTQKILDDLANNIISWDDLFTDCKIDEAILEYIDPEEQNNSMIATKPKDILGKLGSDQIFRYTHCEIHPSTMFGVVSSCIPFPEHNQSPRNTYQCLDINETVLLSNGNQIAIKNVQIDDEVVCFNPETMEISYTKVVRQYVRETDKLIYKITTNSGREIIATEDHKFMTTNGWIEVLNMKIADTKIGILPYQQVMVNDQISGIRKIILTEGQFTDMLINFGFKISLIEKYIKQLTDLDLLPLYNDNYKLPVFARIFGFLLADGSINIYEKNGTIHSHCSFDFGTEEDVKQFENDIEICGFNKCKYHKGSRTFNNTTHTTFATTHGGTFAPLLIALGITYGKKTETIRKPIPEWIMKGTQLIKREFLSGFQGGDGCKIRWNKIKSGYNFVCAETSQQICSEPVYLQSLINYMSQCVALFREFEIEISDVKQCNTDIDDRIKVSYKISDKQENLIKYFDSIGYRYSTTKNTQSFMIVEYLKFKQELFLSHKQMVETIRKMHDEQLTNSTIANTQNLKVSDVSDIVRSYKNNRQISMRHLKQDNIETWLENVCVINNMLFDPIKSIELVSNRLVSDITVASENHSFITTGGILSSNCAQAKQAMGVYATNYNERMDKTAYVLNYPTRPLVDTRVMNLIQLNKIPSGCNINVAIMTHTGYNQEDSVLINKGSIDRGLFQTTIYHTEKDEDKQKINGDEEIRCKPDQTKTKGMKFGNYNKVNSKGVMPENSLVENRDVIIAKVTPIKENRNDHTKVIKYDDQSKLYRTGEETYIDKNYIDRNGDGYSFAKVRLRTTRKPVIGDKFCALPTQQVLTDKGWVEIKDIDIQVHRVATLDVNGNMCYEAPTAKYEYDHDDKMYYIKNKQVHIVCTLNHKLYIKRRAGKKYELMEAQDVMGKMVRFQKTMTNAYPDVEFIQLGDEQYKMDDWLQMLGMFIADGYAHNKIINITALKERKIAFNTRFLEALNIEYKYSTDGKFIIGGKKNKNICEHLETLSVGALNKYLPEYVWNLSQRQSRILLEALLQGDGSSMEYKGEAFERYGTISVQLADDITRLALHCGYSGIVKISEEPTGIARIGKRTLGSRAGQEISVTQQHTYYKVSIITKQNEPWINKKVNDSNEEKIIDYQGKVYCIEVPSSHTYYMREDAHSPCLIIGNSSRHGQKGTVGNIIPEEDMPFTSNGDRPDIIINPHAIPSRMTIGQLKETLLGKVLIELGLFGDGTSFGELHVEDISTKLLELGYEAHGNVMMYNGLTGDQIECNVFMGPVFYQRLKHMVNDKQHSRSIGPMVNLTRQPAEGRSRDGGLRFGEMEKDAMVSHGAAKFTRGRMYDASDKYSVHICKRCGLVASYNNDMHIHHCRTCDNRSDFAYVEIPYACKLLFQELTTMNVVPRVITDH